jgi:hypothetical protein
MKEFVICWRSDFIIYIRGVSSVKLMIYMRMNADGSLEEFDIKHDHSGQLEALQSLVGGYIERVRIGRKFGWVDEEGRLKPLQYNAGGSLLCGFGIYGPLVFKK